VAVGNDEQMRGELGDLLATASRGELVPSDLAARLESLHARFLGAGANTPELVKRRRDAAKAYGKLVAETNIERHHNLELLAQALDLSPPRAP
jgi:hypothetical protein